MKQNWMKVLVVLLSCLLLISTMAGIVSAQGAVNYDVQVNGAEGSVNLRTGPGTGYGLICEIPNGQILHISAMQYNTADGLFYGSTVYNGTSGWVSLRHTAVLSGNGHPAPSFDVIVSAEGGSLNLRQGPGTGYGAILESPNGVQLHISGLQYNAADEFFFGSTVYNGISGWVSLRQTTFTNSVSSVPVSSPISQPVSNTTPSTASPTATTPASSSSIEVGASPVSADQEDVSQQLWINVDDHTMDNTAGQTENTSTTASAARAFLELIREHEQEIRMTEQAAALRNAQKGSYDQVVSVVVADIVGDSTPELIYPTVAEEWGEYAIAMYNSGSYSHRITYHLAVYDDVSDSVRDIWSKDEFMIDVSGAMANNAISSRWSMMKIGRAHV